MDLALVSHLQRAFRPGSGCGGCGSECFLRVTRLLLPSLLYLLPTLLPCGHILRQVWASLCEPPGLLL